MGDELCQLFRVLDLADEAQGLVGQALQPFELTLAGFQVMWQLEQRDCTNKCLAEEAGCAPSNITRLVDRLVELGLAERHPSPDDRRKVVTSLTPEGRDRWSRAAAALQTTQRDLLDRVRRVLDQVETSEP